MTNRIDVEDVLSKLNNVEKISLLAGADIHIPAYPKVTLSNNIQVLIGGIPSPFPSITYLQFEYLMAPMEYVVHNSSMASQQRVSHAALLSLRHGIRNFSIAQVS